MTHVTFGFLNKAPQYDVLANAARAKYYEDPLEPQKRHVIRSTAKLVGFALIARYLVKKVGIFHKVAELLGHVPGLNKLPIIGNLFSANKGLNTLA